MWQVSDYEKKKKHQGWLSCFINENNKPIHFSISINMDADTHKSSAVPLSFSNKLIQHYPKPSEISLMDPEKKKQL